MSLQVLQLTSLEYLMTYVSVPHQLKGTPPKPTLFFLRIIWHFLCFYPFNVDLLFITLFLYVRSIRIILFTKDPVLLEKK